jgi:hypothetical protein
MAISIDAFGSSVLLLGKQGENETTTIEIDVSSWLAESPSATFRIAVIKPGRNTIYFPADVDENGGILTWNIIYSDVEVAGDGKAEVRQYNGSSIKKSVVATTKILPALSGEEDAASPQYASWLDKAAEDEAARNKFCEWTSTELIVKGNKVAHNGCSYVWTLNTPGTGIQPPASGWLCIASGTVNESEVLFQDTIPNTSAIPTLDVEGNILSISHNRGAETIRTDIFSYPDANTIVETRMSGNTQVVISYNLQTMAMTVSEVT